MLPMRQSLNALKTPRTFSNGQGKPGIPLSDDFFSREVFKPKNPSDYPPTPRNQIELDSVRRKSRRIASQTIDISKGIVKEESQRNLRKNRDFRDMHSKLERRRIKGGETSNNQGVSLNDKRMYKERSIKAHLDELHRAEIYKAQLGDLVKRKYKLDKTRENRTQTSAAQIPELGSRLYGKNYSSSIIKSNTPVLEHSGYFPSSTRRHSVVSSEEFSRHFNRLAGNNASAAARIAASKEQNAKKRLLSRESHLSRNGTAVAMRLSKDATQQKAPLSTKKGREEYEEELLLKEMKRMGDEFRTLGGEFQKKGEFLPTQVGPKLGDDMGKDSRRAHDEQASTRPRKATHLESVFRDSRTEARYLSRSKVEMHKNTPYSKEQNVLTLRKPQRWRVGDTPKSNENFITESRLKTSLPPDDFSIKKALSSRSESSADIQISSSGHGHAASLTGLPTFHKKNPHVPIILQNDHLLAVNKPPNTVSQPGRTPASLLLDLLRRQRSEIFVDGRNLFNVHRLDRGTTGVTIFGRTKAATITLGHIFKERRVNKTYLAILKPKPGSPLHTSSIRDCPLLLANLDHPSPQTLSSHLIHRSEEEQAYLQVFQSHSNTFGTISSVLLASHVLLVTYFQTLAHLSHGRVLVAFYPITGRKHQLRTHSAYVLGAPVVGDEKYGYSPHDRRLDNLDSAIPVGGEVALHCLSLGFTLPKLGDRGKRETINVFAGVRKQGVWAQIPGTGETQFEEFWQYYPNAESLEQIKDRFGTIENIDILKPMDSIEDLKKI